jgi:glycogen operon protein
MYDLFSFDEKQNNCGLLNPTCCTDPYSVWCDTDSGDDNNRSRDWGEDSEPFKRQLMRNLYVAMVISHGTPMLYGGDEWLRTQYGNNNAYSNGADNEWNWFRWGEWQSLYAYPRHRMHDFVRDLLTLRRDHAYALAPSEWGEGMDFAWKNSSNEDMGDEDWQGRTLMIHYYDDGTDPGPELAILINMSREDVSFSLPGERNWGRLIDTQSWFDTPGYTDEESGWFDENPEADPYESANTWLEVPAPLTEDTYTVVGSSIVILAEQ